MNIKLKDNTIIRLYDTIYVNTKPEDNTPQKIQGKAISQKNDNMHMYTLFSSPITMIFSEMMTLLISFGRIKTLSFSCGLTLLYDNTTVIIWPDDFSVPCALCYHLAR